MIRYFSRFELTFLFIFIFPMISEAQWQPDPWEDKPRNSLALARESEGRVNRLVEELRAGPCSCAPIVTVSWETFGVEKYKYLSFKVMERSVLALNNLCKIDKQRVCDSIKNLAIEYGSDWALDFKDGDTLFLRVSPGKIPSPEDIEKLLRSALRIKTTAGN